MKNILSSLLLSSLILLGGCAVLENRGNTGVASVPCVYRFKMLSRPEDQSRVENIIRTAALGGMVTKTGTLSYPEYHFRVLRMSDLDKLNRDLVYPEPRFIWSSPMPALSVRTMGVDTTFDSTAISSAASMSFTFYVRPGSRLYYKDMNGNERDITSRVDGRGKVILPVTLRDRQHYVYIRTLKDNVTRYIKINIFTNQMQDVSRSEYLRSGR